MTRKFEQVHTPELVYCAIKGCRETQEIPSESFAGWLVLESPGQCYDRYVFCPKHRAQLQSTENQAALGEAVSW